ncbi:histamine N-methyltransferase-like [Glandiceps talaboti]
MSSDESADGSTEWESYGESIEEWYKCSDDMAQFETWIHTRFLDIVREISFPATKDGLREDVFRHVDVGSGNGQRCCQLLQEILTCHRKVMCRGVEPMADEMSKLKTLVTSKGFDNVTFDLRQQTTEEYQDRSSAAFDTKFQLVTLLEMILVVKDVENTIMHYFDNEMEEGSVMIITVVSDISPTCHCKPLTEDLSPYKVKSSSAVRQALEKNNVKYKEELIPYKVDVTKCFQDDSRAGMLLLDMITVIPEFKKKASPDLFQKVLAVLRSHSTKADDKIYAHFGFDVFIVYKNK